MPAIYKIENSIDNDFLSTFNKVTGEVWTTVPTWAEGVQFDTEQHRNDAIVLINGCAANAGKFIGSVPPGHP